MISSTPSIKAVPAGNSISIHSGKIFINDPHKPVLYTHYVLAAVLGLTGLINGFYFSESNSSINLIVFLISIVILMAFLVREMVYRTYENEIRLIEVSKASITKIPGGKENVNLVIHLKKAKRVVFMSENKAREIKTVVNSLHY